MGEIPGSVEEDDNIPTEFSDGQSFTSGTGILCCLTARESQVGVKPQQRNGPEKAVKRAGFPWVSERR